MNTKTKTRACVQLKQRQPVIVSAKRTPIGSFLGSFADVPATGLGSTAIAAAITQAGIDGDAVEEVLMGNVLTAGLGQGPARQAAIGAGLPDSTEATTVNKVCGSGLKTVIMAAERIACGSVRIVVAGGMESMSQAPYLVPRARSGYRLGHGELLDSMIRDGLWDVYNDCHMGSAAELCARKYNLSREELDDCAVESYERAQKAIATGAFKREIVPVDAPAGKISRTVSDDEDPSRVDLAKLRSLKPAFEQDGVLTAGNSPSCNDGAAALVLMWEHEARARGVIPVAKIRAAASVALAPQWFTIAPVAAINRALKLADLSIGQIDLFEINESFSAVLLAVSRELGISRTAVNVNGGAIALGHPIGATGARLLTTLIHALEDRDKCLGVASLCIGGGEGLAVVVERIT